MTEENTNLEAVEVQPAGKRRARRTAGVDGARKRTPRKTKPSENGAAPAVEDAARKVDAEETPPAVADPVAPLQPMTSCPSR